MFTIKLIRGGSFLFTYAGELISEEEGLARDQVDETGFRFFIKGNNL